VPLLAKLRGGREKWQRLQHKRNDGRSGSDPLPGRPSQLPILLRSQPQIETTLPALTACWSATMRIDCGSFSAKADSGAFAEPPSETVGCSAGCGLWTAWLAFAGLALLSQPWRKKKGHVSPRRVTFTAVPRAQPAAVRCIAFPPRCCW
jgi:hypothetical protein